MKMQRAAVIGAGAMGSGIAQVLSQAGIEVLLKDVKQEFVDKGLASIKRMYDSRVKKEVLTQAEADYLFGMVKGTTTYDGFEDAELVVEAALETIDVKLSIFKELDKICTPSAILASNTSALSISEIAASTKHPERVLGMHFFNPAQTMKLVEVIPGLRTSTEVVDAAMSLCRELRKIPVRVQECPGFLVNRLLFPYMNEALYVLQEGTATPEEIDKAVMELGLPMGPLMLFDLTGIDIDAHVNEFLYAEYGPRFEPAALLQLMLEAKFLGQKSGAGFYLHEGKPGAKDEPKKVNPELHKLIEKARKLQPPAKSPKPFTAQRVMLPMFNEAIYAIQEKVVEAADVDVAMQWGTGMTKGLLTMAEEKGLAWCLENLAAYREIHGERFRSAWLLRKLVRAGVHDFSKLNPTPVAAR
jgi:3-hydroxyacyl-CoA dehydrogenase